MLGGKSAWKTEGADSASHCCSFSRAGASPSARIEEANSSPFLASFRTMNCLGAPTGYDKCEPWNAGFHLLHIAFSDDGGTRSSVCMMHIALADVRHGLGNLSIDVNERQVYLIKRYLLKLRDGLIFFGADAGNGDVSRMRMYRGSFAAMWCTWDTEYQSAPIKWQMNDQ